MKKFSTYSEKRKITPRPVIYNKIQFRSTLEARWAAFFAKLGIRWAYEPDWFLLDNQGDKIAYKPDFLLSDFNLWVEIKPPRQLTEVERKKATYFVALAKQGMDTKINVHRPNMIVLASNVSILPPNIPHGWFISVKSNQVVANRIKLGWDGRLRLVDIDRTSEDAILRLTANEVLRDAFRFAQAKRFKQAPPRE